MSKINFCKLNKLVTINQLLLLIVVTMITITGFYNSFAFIPLEQFVFKNFDQSQNVFLSISFINAIHFLCRPIGGVIWSQLQYKTKTFILPYLILVYAGYNLIIVNSLSLFDLKLQLAILFINFVLAGLFLGGIFPNLMYSLLGQAKTVLSKVIVGNCYFIAVFIGIVIGKLTIAYHQGIWLRWFDLIFPGLFCLLGYALLAQKNLWMNYQIGIVPITKIAGMSKCIKTGYWPIIRLSCFLTFISSLSAFFSTIMPFYLVYYLDYSEAQILRLQGYIFLCAILGLGMGILYHYKLGRKLHIILGLILKIVLYFLFKAYLSNNWFQITLLGALSMFAVGLMLSKIPILLTNTFSDHYKLNSLIIIYNLAFGLFPGIGVFTSTYLIDYYHNLYIPSLIIIGFSYLSLISLWFTPNQDFFRYFQSHSIKSSP